jgi:hypothetical protein
MEYMFSKEFIFASDYLTSKFYELKPELQMNGKFLFKSLWLPVNYSTVAILVQMFRDRMTVTPEQFISDSSNLYFFPDAWLATSFLKIQVMRYFFATVVNYVCENKSPYFLSKLIGLKTWPGTNGKLSPWFLKPKDVEHLSLKSRVFLNIDNDSLFTTEIDII